MKDGGPAFPLHPKIDITDADYVGMSLRDYFAAQAMTGLIMQGQLDYGDVVLRAYLVADAMIAERSK